MGTDNIKELIAAEFTWTRGWGILSLSGIVFIEMTYGSKCHVSQELPTLYEEPKFREILPKIDVVTRQALIIERK